MKKIGVLLVVAFMTVSLFCQDEVDEASKKSMQAQKLAQEKVLELQKKGITDVTVDVTVDDNGDKIVINKMNLDLSDFSKPFIGITYSDITLSEAAEIGYKYFYGIRINSIVSGSSAYYYKLREDDILMAINDDKITNEDALGKIISYHRVGEKVTLKIFRNGKEIEKPFVFGTRKKVFDLDGNLVSDKTESGENVVINAKKVNYGDFTIAWRPSWYAPDFTDVNNTLYNLGFEEETYPEKGIFLNGIGLKAHIGNGWFIGGQYTGFYDEQTSSIKWSNENIITLDSTLVKRKAKFWIHYGGLSFDRRFVYKNLYTELGCLITWGMNKLEIDQKYSPSPPNFDFNKKNKDSDYLNDYYIVSSSLKMKNYGFMAQPRISLGYRVTDWLSFKMEVGYLYTVYMSGWKAEANGKEIGFENEPDTNMDGITLSFGPWFLF